MASTRTFTGRTQEARLIRWRLLSAALIVLIAFAAVLGRLAYLQLYRHQHYSTLSQDNRVRLVPIPPTRGLIYSSDGVVVAENRPSFSLTVVPEQVQDVEKALRQLQSIVDVTPLDRERFEKSLKQKRRFENIPLRFNLTEEEVARFSLDRHRFPGFEIQASLSRYYPYGQLMAPVLGYVGRIDEEDLRNVNAANYSATTHIGKSGVEQAYETVLHGRAGYQQVEVNSHGRILRVLEQTPPVRGDDVHLTVDLTLQQTAMDALANRRGAVVAINPNNGGVLAFVSAPSFDPNPFVNGITSAQYSELRNSADRPLFNRALQAQYPPGSTVKPFLALAGLENGLRRAGDVTGCPGWFTLPGDDHKYRCWKKPGHGQMNMKQAITESCDVYFYQLARDLKIDRIHAMLAEFSFGERTGIDLPGETAGVNPSPKWKRAARDLPWYPGETLIAGIGQGFHLASPLQLAQAASILARHGHRIVPHVAATLRGPESDEVTAIAGTEKEPLSLDPQHWEVVLGAMHEVVQGAHGTARRSAEGAPYAYAGKTGTSQLFGIKQEEDDDAQKQDIPEHLRDHALFIAFAPLESPQIAVAVVVENGGSGSGTAAPVARRLFDQYLLRTRPAAVTPTHG